MSEELEYLPDPLTEEEHKVLDANVLRAFLVTDSTDLDTIAAGEIAINFFASCLIPEIVAYSDVKLRLDTKYDRCAEARTLLQNNPSLMGLLQEALRSRSFRKIRNLAILKKPQRMKPAGDIVECAFVVPYRGAAVDAFYEYLVHNDKLFHHYHDSYCGKFCSIVQSSGTGKSRLIIEMGRKDVIVLYLNLRTVNDNGYPPRDTFPAAVLTKVPRSEREYGARCCAFFTAVFSTLTDHFRRMIGFEWQKPKDIIQDWNEGMCEVESRERMEFFTRVKEKYDQLYPSILAEEAKATSSKALLPGEKTLFAACDTMLRQLKPLFKDGPENHPQLLVALDEAHTLDQDSSLLSFRPSAMVCRAIRAMTAHVWAVWSNHTPVWVAFISTTGIVAEFSAWRSNDNLVSVPVDKRGQELFPPFTELGWDQVADDLTSISAVGAANAEHIVRFGRPLWSSLHEAGQDIQTVAQLAAFKLLGAYELKADEAQVLALLGQRFALEISLDDWRSVAYVESAVASHLRICTRTTMDKVRRYTSYPSEPFLSCMAAHLLHDGYLNSCLSTLRSRVMDGMINVGQGGELASRLLWLLAKDLYIRTTHADARTPLFTEDGELFDCQRFPVVDFFKWVFGDGFWSSEEMTGAEQAFKRAYVNFSHWVAMTENISDQRSQGPENPDLDGHCATGAEQAPYNVIMLNLVVSIR